MQFTARDSEIITFISRHKFATAEQVAEFMEISLKGAYRRLKILVDNKYLYHERIFLQRPGVYYPSRKGIQASGCEISPIKELPLGTYNHDIKLVDLSIYYHKEGYSVKTGYSG